MNTIEQLTSSLELLNAAKADLARLRHEFANRPHLLRLYEPSAKRLVSMVYRSIVDALIGDPTANQEADIWIHLQGRAFLDGKVPAGLLARLLSNLTVANQHAVAILEREGRSPGSAGRFSRRVESLAEFDVVAIAAGSLKVGLCRPDPRRLMGNELRADEEPFAAMLEGDSLAAVAERERTLDGLRLLIRALRASTDETELEDLRRDCREERRLLELLHYAETIAPSERSQVESISFHGWRAEDPGSSFTATSETRRQVRERARKLAPQLEYVEGRGVIRAVDMDKKTFIVRCFTLENEMIDQVACRFPPEMSETEIEGTFNRPVSVSGWLTRQAHGGTSVLEVDSIAHPEGHS